jgi:hypothetical protein
MANLKPATNRSTLKWTKPGPRSKSGWQVLAHNESTGRYRINHFVDVGELPFFATVVVRGRGRSEQISRHNTLEEAKAACEEHLREQSGG